MRTIQPADEGAPPTIRLGGKGALPRTRRALRLAITVLSVVLVWGVLVAPDRIFQLTPAAFARIPVEGLVLVAVAVVLPPWPRRIVAAVAGILFGLLTLVKILNAAFYLEIGRAFNPVFGWLDIPPAIGVVRATVGTTRTNIALVAVGLGLILIIAAITAATIHITTVAARHRRDTVRATRRPHSGLGAGRGPVTATRPGIPGRLDQRRRADRRAGAQHPVSAPRPAPFRAGPAPPRS